MYVDEDGNLKKEKGDKITQEELDEINKDNDETIDDLMEEVEEDVKNNPIYQQEWEELEKAKPEDKWKVIKKYHPNMKGM